MNSTHLYIIILFFLASQDLRHVAARLRCQKAQLAYGQSSMRSKGRIISYKCYRGYSMLGEPYGACIRGKWDPDPPVCVKPGCSSIRNFSNGQITSRMRNALLEFSCKPGYKLVGPSVLYCNGRRWNTLQPYCKAADIRCNFESDTTCSWFIETHDDDDFMWNVEQQETASRLLGTGPKRDHTFPTNDTGHYIMIETGDYGSGTEVLPARIHSPKFPRPTSNNTCFIFWYHMFGSTVGMLNVFVNNRVVFQERGNHGDRWIKGVVSLPQNETDLQIIIEATHGGGDSGNIGLDDFSVGNGTECLYSKVRSCKGRCWEEAAETALCLCHPECYVDSSCCHDYDQFCAKESTVSSSDGTYWSEPITWEYSTIATDDEDESTIEDATDAHDLDDTTPYSEESVSEASNISESPDTSSELTTSTAKHYTQQITSPFHRDLRDNYLSTNDKRAMSNVFHTTPSTKYTTTLLLNSDKLTSAREKQYSYFTNVTRIGTYFRTTQSNNLDSTKRRSEVKGSDLLKSSREASTLAYNHRVEVTSNPTQAISTPVDVNSQPSIHNKSRTKAPIFPTVKATPHPSISDINPPKSTTKASLLQTGFTKKLKPQPSFSNVTATIFESKTSSSPKSTANTRSKTNKQIIKLPVTKPAATITVTPGNSKYGKSTRRKGNTGNHNPTTDFKELPKLSTSYYPTVSKTIFTTKIKSTLPKIAFSVVDIKTSTPPSFFNKEIPKNNTHRFFITKKPFSSTVKDLQVTRKTNNFRTPKPVLIGEGKIKSTTMTAKARRMKTTKSPELRKTTEERRISTYITKRTTVRERTTFEPKLAWTYKEILRTEGNGTAFLETTTKISSKTEKFPRGDKKRKIPDSKENNILKEASIKWNPVNTSQEEFLSSEKEGRETLEKMLVLGALTVFFACGGCLAGFFISRRRRHRFVNDSETDILYASSEEMLDLHPPRNIL